MAIALCIHSNIGGTQQPEFWVIPAGLVITVGMAPVFADGFSYIASSVAVWLVVSWGQVNAMLRMDDANWIVLMTVSGFGLGILLNRLFVAERKKTFLVQRELIRLSFKDALTGINNRRGLMETLQDIHAIASAGDFYFLLIDIDDFKKINDTSGHDVGDRVLIEVASVIGRHAEGYPHGRLGGEEFGVVFNGRADAAQAFAERIREHVASLRIAGHVVTISIGMARLEASTDLGDTVRLADQGLYEAKQRGKNRYVLKP
ncbi:GGDEF domain-containing protein [Dyella sp. EPa41]|uniref:GGDEF domain-containing protein n=1 Tax=Dyella sp. EPa41 TaxID=1561194 RepID=UPI001915662B|nr:GGDEF domain-containing protein [Dyella sp. EPa41]